MEDGSIKELKAFRESLGAQSVGLVPTMGALHKGHLSLISESSRHNAHTIVSVFVNPTQFGQNEDLSTYPRTLEQDLALCENLGVSAVFAPSVEEMYASDDEIAILPPKMLGYVLEGFDRPTHFAGVLLAAYCLLSTVCCMRLTACGLLHAAGGRLFYARLSQAASPRRLKFWSFYLGFESFCRL